MNGIDVLTKQERAILTLVARGWRNAKIASELFISTRTVETHLYHIFDKLGVSSRTEAALYALNFGIANLSESSDGAANQRAYAESVRFA